MNDSLRTDVFVRYPPETIACACIYLSARQLQVFRPIPPFQKSYNSHSNQTYSFMVLY